MGEGSRHGLAEGEEGAWPLKPPRVVAWVTVSCSRCRDEQAEQLILGAGTAALSPRSASTQMARAADVAAPRTKLPVPLVQHRSLDAVEFLVGLPASTLSDLAEFFRACRPNRQKSQAWARQAGRGQAW
jgi:hypothetical protein